MPTIIAPLCGDCLFRGKDIRYISKDQWKICELCYHKGANKIATYMWKLNEFVCTDCLDEILNMEDSPHRSPMLLYNCIPSQMIINYLERLNIV
jgi:hypothetical protein